MRNNWAFLIWIGLASLACNFAHGERRELVNGKTEWRVKLLWAIVFFAPVAICAAMRGLYEGDSPLSSKIQKNNWARRKILCKRYSTKSRMALESRADSGLNPLFTESHGGQNGMRAGTA